jgi:hypothetical protein
MKISVIPASALALAFAATACTKSKSSDPAPQPAAQGQTGKNELPQTTTDIQKQWNQNTQQQQNLPFQLGQGSFTMRLPTAIVGEPNLEVALFPNMKDAHGKEVVLPYVDQHIMSGGQVAIPTGSKVWGKVRLALGGQSTFTAGGFILPNGQQFATSGLGLIESQDISQANWSSAGLNGLIGAGAGSAIGLILAVTTGDKKVQAWEVLTGTGSGAILGALSSLIWPSLGNRMVSIKADNTLPSITVHFNATDASKLPGYKIPTQQQQQQQ